MRRFLTLGCLLAVAFAASVVAVPGAHAAPSSCVNSQFVGGDTNAPSVAILLVHGITAGPGMWDKAGDIVTMVSTLKKIPHAAVYAYDYSSHSLDWVTKDTIKQPLSDAIACLAKGGHRVIVVAHSMGGLATQVAQSLNSAGRDSLGPVITLGTPTLGSPIEKYLLQLKRASLLTALLPVADPVQRALALDAYVILKVCGAAGQQYPVTPNSVPPILQGGGVLALRRACDFVAAIDTDAGRAMAKGSTKLTELPPWAGGVTRHRIGAALTVTVDLFGIGWTPFGKGNDTGDVIVDPPSALADPTDTYTLPCHDIGVWEFALSPCFHTNLASNPDVLTDVEARVRMAIDAQIGPPPVSTIDWRNHDYTMTCAGDASSPFVAHVRNGEDRTAGATGTSHYEVALERVSLPGDLTGDGVPEVAVLLYCSSQPSNFYGLEMQVFTGGPRLLDRLHGATLYPRDQVYDDRPFYDPGEITIADGLLRTGARFYAPGDPHAAGPTIHRIITWRWNGTRFVPTVPGAGVPGPSPLPGKPIPNPTPSPPSPNTVSVTIPATGSWVDSGLVLRTGQSLKISALGRWQDGSNVAGPDGTQAPSPDNYFNLTDLGACATCATTPAEHHDALVGYIGDAPPAAGSYVSTSVLPEAQKIFYVGSNYSDSNLQRAGKLWLNINADAYSGYTVDNSGSITATITG